MFKILKNKYVHMYELHNVIFLYIFFFVNVFFLLLTSPVFLTELDNAEKAPSSASIVVSTEFHNVFKASIIFLSKFKSPSLNND